MSTNDVLPKVRDLASGRASGEFICATSSLEIHVYLQGGRIAWATDSKHPFAFAKHLQKTADIDEGTFKEVIEACRRDRLPLGETLVDWKLVSWQQVRASLRHQIARAFHQLSQARGGHTLFLDRGYADYNPELTFDVGEFLPEGIDATADWPTDAAEKSGLACQLRESIEGLEWVEVLEGETLVDADPDAGGMRTPHCVLKSTILDRADFVAVRSERGSLVGVVAGESGRSLWCQLAPDCSFGAAVSTLWTITSMGVHMGPVSSRHPSEMVCFASQDGTLIEREIAGFLKSATDVLAAVVLDDGALPQIGFSMPGVDSKRLLETALARRECLACPLWASGDKDSVAGQFYLKTMVSGEGDVWCFGAELGGRPAQTLWLFLERGCPQGLGWAYLSTLYRSLSHLPQ